FQRLRALRTQRFVQALGLKFDDFFHRFFSACELFFSRLRFFRVSLLAIAAAAGDRECVKLCEQYIRQWFGHRLAQWKCLVEVLAWIEHSGATQVLFSLANRFRTKAIRQAAEAHVQALAERQGWTRDELADRTIPDAGFERPC
ncbi:hypothetical protein C2W62_52795, partial [Candidatus Entotheonella serta]